MERSAEEWLHGYYPIEGKKVTCVLNRDIVLDFEYAESIKLQNPLRIDTDLIITVGGRESRVNSLAAEFANAGVDMPTREVVWRDDTLMEKEPDVATPPPAKKARVLTASNVSPSASEPAAASQAASGAVLSAVLRKRLTQKISPTK